jgi:hypothetical protein
MDLLLIIFWLLTALAFLFALIASVYYIHVRGAKPLDVFAKLLLALIVYCFTTLGTGFLAGMTLFLGGLANRPGSILDTRGLLIGYALLVLYASIGWLICSFIVGKILLPYDLLTRIARSGKAKDLK